MILNLLLQVCAPAVERVLQSFLDATLRPSKVGDHGIKLPSELRRLPSCVFADRRAALHPNHNAAQFSHPNVHGCSLIFLGVGENRVFSAEQCVRELGYKVRMRLRLA